MLFPRTSSSDRVLLSSSFGCGKCTTQSYCASEEQTFSKEQDLITFKGLPVLVADKRIGRPCFGGRTPKDGVISPVMRVIGNLNDANVNPTEVPRSLTLIQRPAGTLRIVAQLDESEGIFTKINATAFTLRYQYGEAHAKKRLGFSAVAMSAMFQNTRKAVDL